MIRLLPRSTLPATLFPSTTLFRSPSHARTDRVHADVLLRIIERRGLGQLYDAGLGGAIDAVMLHADDGRRRRGVDDRATAGFQHRRDAVFHAEEHAFQIDGLDLVIAVFALLVQCHHLAAEASVVDQHIERSEEQTSELQSLMRRSYAVFCL